MEDNTRISSLLKMVDIRIRQDLDARNQDLHISSSQMRALSYLIANTDHEINPRDLEQYFRISKPTVAGILKRLEEKGFLHYEESSKDLRYKQIVLDEPAYRCIAQLRLHTLLMPSSSTYNIPTRSFNVNISAVEQI